jgi:hypothetical protein
MQLPRDAASGLDFDVFAMLRSNDRIDEAVRELLKRLRPEYADRLMVRAPSPMR